MTPTPDQPNRKATPKGHGPVRGPDPLKGGLNQCGPAVQRFLTSVEQRLLAVAKPDENENVMGYAMFHHLIAADYTELTGRIIG